jgi:4-hydroxy-tetrahydrodipicolinate synthase
MHSATLPKGIFSAQWIPSDASGRIDRASLASHLEFEKRAGINGVLALGSTGEFPHFTVEERKRILDLIAELARPLTIYANITDIRPRAAIEIGRHAKQLGMAAIALMWPKRSISP